jgi:hypothetical protein
MSNANISFLLDNSGSMADGYYGSGIYYLADVKTDASTFIYIMAPGDALGLVNFNATANYLYGSSSSLITIPLTNPSSVQNAATDAINGLTATGKTNISQAIEYGNNQLSTASTPKAMVLLSDGKPTAGITSQTALLNSLPSTTINTISLGSHGQVNLMAAIAKKTGGTHHLSPTPFDLEEIYNAIVGDTGVATVKTNQQHHIPRFRFESSEANYDSAATTAIFAVNWDDLKVYYTDKTPTGEQVNISLNGPSGTVDAAPYKVGNGFVVYKLANPEQGKYTATAWYSGSKSLNCTIGMFGLGSTLQLDAGVNASLINAGEAIEYHAHVLHGADPIPATINISMESPQISPDEALAQHQTALSQIKPKGDSEEMSDNAKMLALQMQRGPANRLIPVNHQPLTLACQSGSTKKTGEVATNVAGAHILRVTAHGVSPVNNQPFTLSKRISVFAQ